jgi:phage shock protein A
MSYWKRWTSGVAAQLDRLVSQVENHEALVESAVLDMRTKTGRAKARLERVRRDGRELRERLQQERAAVDAWRQRAVACDEELRAFECLRRSHRAQTLAEGLAARVAEHERVEAQLTKELRVLEERVSEVKQTYHVMRTRQTRADALACLQRASAGTDIESVLERWEGCLAEHELGADLASSESDTFEADFASAEEKALLAAELAALRGRHE